jgi:spore maturation protein B
MMGSSETLLYAVAVYFGATAVKKLRHTVISGVAGYVAGILLSLVFCRIM